MPRSESSAAISWVTPVRTLDDVVLSPAVRRVIDQVLIEHARAYELRKHGFLPINKLMFCGPPGCGKTATAEALAKTLGLPFAIISLDRMVGSYLGETGRMLAATFAELYQKPSVALFDEFDALGLARHSGANDCAEMSRVVNSLLVMLDAYKTRGCIIAATNHQDVLDRALWRRFEEVAHFSRPTAHEIEAMIKTLTRRFPRAFKVNDGGVMNLFDNASHADIERVMRRAIKAALLAGDEKLEVFHVHMAHARETERKVLMLEEGA